MVDPRELRGVARVTFLRLSYRFAQFRQRREGVHVISLQEDIKALCGKAVRNSVKQL